MAGMKDRHFLFLSHFSLPLRSKSRFPLPFLSLLVHVPRTNRQKKQKKIKQTQINQLTKGAGGAPGGMMHAVHSRVAVAAVVVVVVGTVHRCCSAANGHIHNGHVVVGTGYGY